MNSDPLARCRYLWEEKLDEYRLREVVKDGKVIGHLILHVLNNTVFF